MNNFSREEAEEILVRAVRDSKQVVSRGSLEEMANEAGISPEHLERAIQAHRVEVEDARILAAFKIRRREKFWGEASQYIGTSVVCTAIWFLTGRNYFWPGWVFFGCGIGLLEEVARTFLPQSRSYERALRKFKAQQGQSNGDADAFEVSNRARVDHVTSSEHEGTDLSGIHLKIGVHNGSSRKD